MIFDLIKDFADVLDAMPEEHPRRRILKLLDEAIRRDVHFIDRHSTTFFQCMWNNCWWYDCLEAAKHYEKPEERGKEDPPWERDGKRLCDVLETWRIQKEEHSPGFVWLRSLRPPPVHLGTVQLAVLSGHETNVESVVFSSDGRRVVSGSHDRTVRVWDVETGEELRRLDHENWVERVWFSIDDRQIVSGSAETVRVWDAETGEKLCQLNHEDPVRSLGFSASTRLLISAPFTHFTGRRGYGPTLRVLDVETGKQIRQLVSCEEQVISLGFSSDGLKIVSGDEGNAVRVRDAQTGEELCRLDGHGDSIWSVAFSPDNQRIVSGSFDNMVRIWDAETGEQLQQLVCHDLVYSVAISPDGKRIASGSADTTVRVWDAETGEQIRQLNGHENCVSSVAFSPDGRRIVSGSYDKTVRIWDIESGEELQRLNNKSSVLKVFYSPDGRLIASSSFFAARVWDTAISKPLHWLDRESNVSCVAFSNDGQLIVSGSKDKTVRVWDSKTGYMLCRLYGHENEVSSVAFCDNNRQIVSRSGSGPIRFWDIETSKCLEVLEGEAEVESFIAGEAPPFCPRALDLETVIERTDDGQPVAFFSAPLPKTSTNTTNRRSVGSVNNHLYVLHFEGANAAEAGHVESPA